LLLLWNKIVFDEYPRPAQLRGLQALKNSVNNPASI